ncbi:TetR/AcrR family transcriptional regulator [Streptomyces sp. NPDC016309]|uniref:TetR/AcrR family transcriptional regulator n=1 Tax=Streptomyces sp. NPDC016309 TaxID=3364965 RepID=UPI0036F6F253
MKADDEAGPSRGGPWVRPAPPPAADDDGAPPPDGAPARQRPPGGGAPAGERPPDRASTRERLLAAASGLFAERGYERATVRDIASRARVNQALLFRHFGSKRALFGEVVSRDGTEQLRNTPPERLVETVLTSMLAPPALDGGGGSSRSLETLLRSVGAGDEVSAAVTALGDDYARALATLSDADDNGLRGDLALSWLLGIGLMRVVVGKRPLADADAGEVSRLVVGTLGGLLDGMAPPRDRGAGQD